MLLNSILFNLAWFGCVIFGDEFGYLVVVWFVIHLLYRDSFKSEFILVIIVTLIGIFVDSALVNLGVFIFSDYQHIIPIWLMMIWLAFAMTLNGYLSFLKGAFIRQSVVGYIFAPLSYLAGNSLGAVSFGYPIITTLLILSALWAMLLPLFFQINQYIQGISRDKDSKIIG